MLDQSLVTQLRDQLNLFEEIFPNVSPEVWEQRPAIEKWSAREHFAHLGRYHEVLLERLRRIGEEGRPRFGRYRAEEDPEWKNWQSLPMLVLEERIRSQRQELIAYVNRLSATDLCKTGIHPVLGEMNVSQWIQFFLLHEAHHLYTILFTLYR